MKVLAPVCLLALALLLPATPAAAPAARVAPPRATGGEVVGVRPFLLEQGGPAARNRLQAARLDLLVGGERVTIDGATLLALTGIDPEAARIERAVIDPAALRRLLGRRRITAAEEATLPARYLVDADGSGAITGIRESRDGQAVDLVTSARLVAGAINRLAQGRASTISLAMVMQPKPSAIDAARLTALRPRLSLLAAHEVRYTPAASNGNAANILVPGRALAGLVIAPGEWFDFWHDVGPVTREAGYRQGGAFIGGVIQPTGAFAGGICAVSTALYAAAAQAGLALGERHEHTSWLTRYPLGLDATVWTSPRATRSMRFQNDTTEPLTILVRQRPGFLRAELWGVADGRTVEIAVGPLRNRRVGPSGNVGGQVTVIRTVLDAAGRELHRDVIRSSYSPS